jgi:hypothetical protein
MKAEFFRPEQPDEVVAVAEWDGRTVRIDADDERIRDRLNWMFRQSPVVIGRGTGKERAIEPGDLEWFQAAATERAEEARLEVRLVVSAPPGGWDPAGTYRPMRVWLSRRHGGAAPSPGLEPGYF